MGRQPQSPQALRWLLGPLWAPIFTRALQRTLSSMLEPEPISLRPYWSLLALTMQIRKSSGQNWAVTKYVVGGFLLPTFPACSIICRALTCRCCLSVQLPVNSPVTSLHCSLTSVPIWFIQRPSMESYDCLIPGVAAQYLYSFFTRTYNIYERNLKVMDHHDSKNIKGCRAFRNKVFKRWGGSIQTTYMNWKTHWLQKGVKTRTVSER
jgi:hypothetical protein